MTAIDGIELEQECETWDWARTAGVSAEDLREALRNAPAGPQGPASGDREGALAGAWVGDAALPQGMSLALGQRPVTRRY